MNAALLSIVLTAALLHAAWNFLVKRRGEQFFILALINFGITVLAAPFLFLVPFPAAAAWPFIIASVVVHVVYHFTLIKAYRHSDLGYAYPIARGSAPLWVTLGALVFAAELPGAMQAAGIVFICTAVLALALEKGLPRMANLRPAAVALATGLLIAAYTVIDGLGVRTSIAEGEAGRLADAAGYMAWLFFLDGWVLAVYAAFTNGAPFAKFARRNWLTGLVGGAAAVGAYSLIIYALSQGAMGLIAALRETSVLFATALGILFLGERLTAVRVVAGVVIVVGVVLLGW
ncbi:MAG: EamA family transporter [Gammaproteobacteria bacterium]|nr:EamA family transporter [Gammaproteobacteria bacterium]